MRCAQEAARSVVEELMGYSMGAQGASRALGMWEGPFSGRFHQQHAATKELVCATALYHTLVQPTTRIPLSRERKRLRNSCQTQHEIQLIQHTVLRGERLMAVSLKGPSEGPFPLRDRKERILCAAHCLCWQIPAPTTSSNA